MNVYAFIKNIYTQMLINVYEINSHKYTSACIHAFICICHYIFPAGQVCITGVLASMASSCIILDLSVTSCFFLLSFSKREI